MRKIDRIVDSEKDKCKFQIASGYISETAIHFEKEGIIALVQASGHVDYYDLNDELLASADAPSVDSGREVYEEVSCEVVGNTIIIGFPIVKWIDNYPNCDGEHDRWDSVIIGYNTVNFDISDNTVEI